MTSLTHYELKIILNDEGIGYFLWSHTTSRQYQVPSRIDNRYQSVETNWDNIEDKSQYAIILGLDLFQNTLQQLLPSNIVKIRLIEFTNGQGNLYPIDGDVPFKQI